jgi:alkylation response protein AidB-like acyl-CoA dehydrogenase
MEYKSQRLYRDARIFSIYEGTTQLQVVAAIRYVTNGTYLQVIKDMMQSEVSEEMRPLKARIAPLVDLYEQAVNYVKEQGNQDVHDFLARRLYDMTAEIIMSLLIMDDATRAPELFAKSANVYVRMTEEDVCAKAYYVMHFTEADLVSFRAE